MAQVWLVTGSSRGLGRAIVEAGLAAGNKVLATARDIEPLLGSDAYNGAEKNDLARLEEARSWKELSLSTDFESKPPHLERPKVNLPSRESGPRTCRLFAPRKS